MSRRDDVALLEDMLEAARTAVVAVRGRSLDTLSTDPVWALGLVKCLEIIGEAARQISPAVRARYPEVPWRQMGAMRNRLVHAYFAIDYEQVRNALVEGCATSRQTD